MNFKPFALALPLLFAACAQQPVKPQPAKPVEAAKPAPAKPKLPDIVLSEDLLYEFLLGEIAGQRGNLGIATEAYVDMAKKTHDPRIVSRALDIALFSGNAHDALEMAKLLEKLDPDSQKAKEALSPLLAHSGNLAEARPGIEKLLAQQSGEKLGRALLELNNLFANQQDKQAVLVAVQDLTKPYLAHPEAHHAIAFAAWQAGRLDLALEEADKAESMQPGWELPALLKLQVLEQQDKNKVRPFVEHFLGKYPKSQGIRLAYAKFLVSEKQYTEARKEFVELKRNFPENREVSFAVGLLSLQLGDADTAISEFKGLLDKGYPNPDFVRYYLGQSFEKKNEPLEAEKWYGSIGPGNQYLPAKGRIALIIQKRKGLEAARRYLHRLPAHNEAEKIVLIEAEAQMLHDAKQYRTAFSVLSKGLAKFPDSSNLLYDQAMAAEKIGRIREAEKSLKKLIRMQPNFAQAYNALGYTLVEHTTRYKEAQQLLEKALALSPEDPFILDSMGWLQYKMGHKASGLTYLKRAYSGQHDPEIAAHLAEVLWATGSREDARRLLESSLKANPGNAALEKSMKKFGH